MDSTQISVLWGVRVRDQMFQVLRNNEIANSFPAINCRRDDGYELTGGILKMEITAITGYSHSCSSLFYRYQQFHGKYTSI